jgi:hypothetical protein
MRHLVALHPQGAAKLHGPARPHERHAFAAVETLEGRRLLCFSAPIASPGGGAGLSVGDFNGDHRDDAAVFDAKGQVGVRLSNGDGTFRQGATLGGVTGTPYTLSAADFNGDGRKDLSAWGFRSSTTNSTGKKSMGSMASADGVVGPAGCLQSCGTFPVTGTMHVSTWLGNGDGTFRAATTSSFEWRNYPPTGPASPQGTQADFNRDGWLDSAWLDWSPTRVISLQLSNPDGTYQAPLTVRAGRDPGGLGSGDFNGDGRVDLIVVNSLSSKQPTLSVLLNDALW